MKTSTNVFNLDDLTLIVDPLPGAGTPTYTLTFTQDDSRVVFFGRPSQGVAMAEKLRAAADQIEQLAARQTGAAK